MAISTYTELQAAIENWLARPGDTIVSSRSPEFIALAEAQFNRELRHRAMETQTTIVTIGGVDTVPLPGDFVEARSIIAQTSPKVVLTPVTPQQMAMDYPAGETGIPCEYAVIGSNLHFAQTPNSAYNITLTYYAKIPALSANATNWLLTAHPDAYLYGALLQASPFMGADERLSTWGLFYKRAIDAIRYDDQRATVGAGPLRARVGIAVA